MIGRCAGRVVARSVDRYGRGERDGEDERTESENKLEEILK